MRMLKELEMQIYFAVQAFALLKLYLALITTDLAVQQYEQSRFAVVADNTKNSLP